MNRYWYCSAARTVVYTTEDGKVCTRMYGGAPYRSSQSVSGWDEVRRQHPSHAYEISSEQAEQFFHSGVIPIPGVIEEEMEEL